MVSKISQLFFNIPLFWIKMVGCLHYYPCYCTCPQFAVPRPWKTLLPTPSSSKYIGWQWSAMRQYNFYTVLLFKQIQPHLFQGSKNTIEKKKKKRKTQVIPDMLLQKPASSLRHYTDYSCLRLCANQPQFQSEHFWKFPSNMYVDMSSTHHTTSEESPLQRIILWKTGWLLLNNNQNSWIYTSIYIQFETVNLHLLTS